MVMINSENSGSVISINEQTRRLRKRHGPGKDKGHHTDNHKHGWRNKTHWEKKKGCHNETDWIKHDKWQNETHWQNHNKTKNETQWYNHTGCHHKKGSDSHKKRKHAEGKKKGVLGNLQSPNSTRFYLSSAKSSSVLTVPAYGKLMTITSTLASYMYVV